MVATTKTAWCVFASGFRDATGRTYAAGDGITRPTRRLYALADSQAEARHRKACFERGALLTRCRRGGDGRLYPELEIGRYDPLDFVGRQHRDDYTGKRYAQLCGRLADQATENAKELL